MSMKDFIKKLNEAEDSMVDLGIPEYEKNKTAADAEKAEKPAFEKKEESDEDEEGDPVVNILKQALEQAGYDTSEENVEALVADLKEKGLDIELEEDSDLAEIVNVLVKYLQDNDEDAEEGEEPDNEHEASESDEEEKEEHMGESVKSKKKLMKEGAMANFGIAQVDKLSRSLGALEGLIDSIKDEKTKTKFNKIYGDLNSIITDLSNDEMADESSMEIPEEMPMEEPVAEELPVVEEPADDEPQDTEVAIPAEGEEEPVAEEPVAESITIRKPTIQESAAKYLDLIDWA